MKKALLILLKALTVNYYFQRKAKNRLLILMFHQVNNNKTLYYPAMSTEAFRDLCKYIKQHYEVISISKIKEHFSNSSKPAAIISFDDGHYDIMQNAYPILSELGLPFNINIDTEILETGKPQDYVRVYDILNNSDIDIYQNPKLFNKKIAINRQDPMQTENEFTELLSSLSIKQKRDLTDDLALKAGVDETTYSKMLSIEDIKFLNEQGVEFGSHSHTHPILTEINQEEIYYELKHSKQILENILNKEIKTLAYPNGIYNEETERIATETGYSVLLQTNDEINKIQTISNRVNSYKRVNQYHSNLNEALAHTYGVTKFINKLKSQSL